MTLGDRIACMYEGVFQQVGTPEEIYDAPVNKFVAGFIGIMYVGTSRLAMVSKQK